MNKNMYNIYVGCNYKQTLWFKNNVRNTTAKFTLKNHFSLLTQQKIFFFKL